MRRQTEVGRIKGCELYFLKEQTEYEIGLSLVGSEKCIRDRVQGAPASIPRRVLVNVPMVYGSCIRDREKHTPKVAPHVVSRFKAVLFYKEGISVFKLKARASHVGGCALIDAMSRGLNLGVTLCTQRRDCVIPPMCH